jgi:hypothetical protein
VDAKSSYLSAIDDLASTTVSIGYKNPEDNKMGRQITGSALAFGITPTLLQIQSGTIEVKTALTINSNANLKSTVGSNAQKTMAGYRFKASTVDARYQNAYNYKAETASTIRITVVPVPVSKQLADTIKAVQEKSAIIESGK